MTARQLESELLARCVAQTNAACEGARDQREANVFRLAAMVLQSRLPKQAELLMRASEVYFSSHSVQPLPAADVLKNGWVVSLPRLRDMLSHVFARETNIFHVA